MKRIVKDSQTRQLLVICLVLFALMTLLKPDKFLRPVNINSMLVQLAEPGFFAVAIAITTLSGGIDLSIVSIANLVGIVNGILIRNMITPESGDGETLLVLLLCAAVGIAIGFLGGLLNGFLIAEMGIFPILVTLGTQNLFAGIAMILTQGRAEGNFPQMLLNLGNTNLLSFEGFLGLPLVTVFFLVIFILLCVVVHRTPYGLKLQWFGSNSRAAYFTGIDNKKVVYKTYLICGVISALAGLVIMARTNSAKADYGHYYVFEALLICVLSGISPLGGKGKLYNVLLALLALQILSTGFNMLRVSPLIRDSLFGFLLVISVTLDYMLTRRRAEKLNRSAIASAKAMQDSRADHGA